LGFAGGSDRKVVKRHVVAGRKLVELAVVRNDGANVQRQQATFPAEQQIVQAMPFLAHHDDGAHRLRPGVQAPVHLVGLGKSGELALQFFMQQLRTGKLHAHEKQPGTRIVVLRRLLDVAAALGQKA